MTAFSLAHCPFCKTKLQAKFHLDDFGALKIYQCTQILIPWGKDEMPHYNISYKNYDNLIQNIILSNNLFLQNHCQTKTSDIYNKNGKLLVSLPRLSLTSPEEMKVKVERLLPFI
jgi:hypothetical protein